MNPFAYDFGYGWQWNYGHVVPLVLFGALAITGARLRRPRWIVGVAAAIAAWAAVGLFVIQFVVRMNLPLELPTERFLASGGGTVLDAGAGSGRSSLMVLLERPGSRVLALDLYEGYFGIEDNTPHRLLANAAQAGVEDRIEVKVGDVREMPLGDDSVDAAVSAYVIDHLSDEGVERSLSEIRRVLRPGGELLLMVIRPDVWIRVAYPMFAEHGYFGADHSERWRGHLEDAGLEIVEEGTIPGTLYLVAKKPTVQARPRVDFGQRIPYGPGPPGEAPRSTQQTSVSERGEAHAHVST